eukprot:Pompholyxophrys_punicea_v1_NODE_649_length_1527_cov_7.620245.p1 type:complete len:359 gc:universal NODE_649_length_1527_cov_7.620245:1284-208(-)
MNKRLYEVVFGGHSTAEVKYHAVYMIEYLNVPQKTVAHFFAKSESTISRWVAQYHENDGNLERRNNTTEKRFLILSPAHHHWILEFVKKNPLSYLAEIKQAFKEYFRLNVSCSSIFRILKENGYTKKVIEQIAKEISFDDVVRFSRDINSLNDGNGVLLNQLLFLDEFSTDNRSMLRQKGWFLHGRRPVMKTLFQRGKRLSCLTYLGVDGIVDNYHTEGTFNRQLFFECCKSVLNSGKVERFPGKHSVWVLDGAAIHLDPEIVQYFFERGIYIVFLPAYAPIYNPIEIVFGLVKRRCKALYKADRDVDLQILFQVLTEFHDYDMKKLFNHCGYLTWGGFDMRINSATLFTLLGDNVEV